MGTAGNAQPSSALYFNQSPAGLKGTVFAPGVISLPDRLEFGSIYSKDGSEFYYGLDINGKAETHFRKFENGKWSEPVVLLSHKEYSFNDPFLTPDEKRLFFISDRPINGEGPKKDYDIWYIERTASGWSPPVNAGPNINSPRNEYYTSFTKSGSIYFSSYINGAEGSDDYDIYTCAFKEGKFQKAVRLGPEINSTGYEGDVYVDPNETYLIFCSNRPGTIGRGDLFISYRRPDGTWTPCRNMGKDVNSARTDYCPFVTPDGKYLLYSAESDIKWIDAKVIEMLRN